MTDTPITDAFGERLIALIRTAKEEIPTLGAVSTADSKIAGLLADALGEILAVTQSLEERINAVAQTTPDVAPRSLTADLPHVGF